MIERQRSCRRPRVSAQLHVLEPRRLLSVARPAGNTGTGFFVSGNQVYDANGNPFVMKGVNAVHAWGSYNTNYNTIDQVAKTGANTVRAVMYQDITSDSGNPWTDAADTPARRQTVAERYLANGMAVVVEDHASIADGGSVETSKVALDEITQHWLTNEPWLKQYEKYVIVNIANEWGQPAHAADSDHSWRDAYIDEVGKLRRGPDGIAGTADDVTNMLMIDAGAWGQDYNTLRFDAQAVENADPQHNIVFSIHLYGSWRDESRAFEVTAGNDYGPWDINTSLTQLHNAGLPLVVGEFAWEDFKDFGSSSAPYGAYRTQRVLQILDGLGVGWIGWSYNGSSPQTLNVLTNLNNTTYNSNTDLSEWGNELINDPVYGLKASARRATVFDDPLPAMPNPPSPLPALPSAMPSDVRIVLKATTIGVAEGGQGVVLVRLNQQPDTNVTINLTKNGGGDADLNLNTATLTFTPSNWNQYQPILLTANADADTTVGTAKFTLADAAGSMAATDFLAKEIEPPAAPSGNVFTITPDRDRLYSGSGTLTSLTVDSVFPTPNNNPTPNGTMYLRFPISSVRGRISSVTLRLFTTNTTAGRRVRVYGALGDAWTETSTPSNTTPIYASYPLFPGTDNSGFALPTAGGSYVDISFAELTNFVSAEYLKDGIVTLAVRMTAGTAVFNTRESTSPPQLVINTVEAVPPQVTAAAFDYTVSANRLTFTFSEDVSASLSTADVVLQSISNPGTTLTLSAPTFDPATNTAVYTFAPGVVPDGTYRATLLAAGVADAVGNALLVGRPLDFFSLAGDANHDKAVDLTDFTFLATNFNGTGKTFGEGDFNYDGVVDLTDFTILASNFNHTLPAASAAIAAARPAAAPAQAMASGAWYADHRDDELQAVLQ